MAEEEPTGTSTGKGGDEQEAPGAPGGVTLAESRRGATRRPLSTLCRSSHRLASNASIRTTLHSALATRPCQSAASDGADESSRCAATLGPGSEEGGGLVWYGVVLARYPCVCVWVSVPGQDGTRVAGEEPTSKILYGIRYAPLVRRGMQKDVRYGTGFSDWAESRKGIMIRRPSPMDAQGNPFFAAITTAITATATTLYEEPLQQRTVQLFPRVDNILDGVPSMQ
ncbi:predicted protein [Histoplasma capsulatum var. duboisii H88]|uniref:Predicted protein n=2 Tax=Ajellomyces capsulatus TaxID=5037 RepID=F0UEF7_AJEC8|nr:predicted protein [Histoplasma capsulatum H143]EGC44687.1 predicted protein [Histoplasma capsulatum var. duboisii H88]